MNVVVFGPARRVGILEEGRIVDLNALDAEPPPALLPLIELGRTAKARSPAPLRRCAARQFTTPKCS